MGTHAVYGFKKDNKYKITYSNFDGGYNDIGTLIINFVNTTSITEMNTIFEKIVLVDVLDIPTEKQIQECKKYANLEIATRTLKDFVIKEYPLENIPENWIEECDKNADICYQKWKSQENEVD